MRYVLDASVAVAALRASEPHHADALRRCMPLFAGADEIVVPAIFDVEVVSALARRGVSAAGIERFFEAHFATRRLVTLGPRAARAARAVAANTQLRAADAFYVWVAAREGLPLVTLDGDVLARAGAVCRVMKP
ncbi:MAG TPA: type II toxin-antitoxin system VapC family toxin [Polyangiaceae bacterium]